MRPAPIDRSAKAGARRPQRSFLDRVAATAASQDMFEKGERVVVGVSGGPDSVALLTALLEMNASLCLRLTVAHLDHHIRRGSDRDRVFVEDACRRLGLPCIARTLPPAAGRSFSEDALRRRRYAFFEEACRIARARTLALGHTRDDQAETVLMRLLRGTGLSGLAGILPVTQRGTIKVVRPLLEVEREDILAFLKGRRLSWRRDPTNERKTYLRNRIRHDLLPRLEKEYNPALRETLAGLAVTAGADYRHMERCAAAFLRRAARTRGGILRIGLQPLSRADAGLRRAALRLAVRGLCGHLRRFTWSHWREVEDLILRRPVGAEVHLPNGLRARKEKGRVAIFSLKRKQRGRPGRL
ncbi:MAG: tRNA lysidine(34) synthetase TilS [Deltaproteobacteria bacterium]